MNHISREELDAYVTHRMGIFRSFGCFLHLRKCQECQLLLRECREDEKFLDSVRKAQRKFDLPDDPEEIERLSTCFGEKPEK